MEWLFTIPDTLVRFFTWLLAEMSILSDIALGVGNVLATLLFISAPAFIAYFLMRYVTRTTEKQLGWTEALITAGIFAVCAGGALGSMFGVAHPLGGMAIVTLMLWTMLTASGFLLGCRKVLGTGIAVALSSLIPPLAVLLGLTVYAA